jgi:hypothetical protein
VVDICVKYVLILQNLRMANVKMFANSIKHSRVSDYSRRPGVKRLVHAGARCHLGRQRRDRTAGRGNGPTHSERRAHPPPLYKPAAGPPVERRSESRSSATPHRTPTPPISPPPTALDPLASASR